MNKKKSNRRFLTILELMIVIAIVAIAGGALFWRLSRLIDVKRVYTDSARLRGVLLSSRMLAINTKSDWELEIQETKKGWSLRLIALEEPGKEFACGKISRLKLRLDETGKVRRFGPVEARMNEGMNRIAFRFFSTGQVAPAGVLDLGKEQIEIPALFHQEQGTLLGPIHPDDLKKR
jgi:Tfp pilus assembly protein FimT